MRQKYILALMTFGIFLSGFTWAGPPEVEDPPDETTVIEPETPTYGSGTPEMSEPVEENAKEYLTFEEAVAVCSDREDMQTCIDAETGQAEIMEAGPEDRPMDSDLPETDLDTELEIDLNTEEESGPE